MSATASFRTCFRTDRAKGFITPPTPRSGTSTRSRDTSARRGDVDTLRSLMPTLLEIVSCHLTGTQFGIGVDPADGLLTQGADGYQLTWMDAKVGDWVVTPRRGKAVEINALWFNALQHLESWTRQFGEQDGSRSRATRRASTRARSTSASGRPSTTTSSTSSTASAETMRRADRTRSSPSRSITRFSTSDRWADVLAVVSERLLTPVGLRSLDPGHPDYKPMYFGDLRSRDAAYHQGTVWAWLIGPFVDAWLKGTPRRSRGRASPAGRIRVASGETRASDRSRRSSTPSNPTCRAAASRKRGASRRSCGPFAHARPDGTGDLAQTALLAIRMVTLPST